MNWPESEEYKDRVKNLKLSKNVKDQANDILTSLSHIDGNSNFKDQIRDYKADLSRLNYYNTPHPPRTRITRPQSPNVITRRNRNRTGGKTQSKRRSRQGSKTRKHKNKQRR